MNPFTYAFRNMRRAGQRTLIMIAAMAFAGAIMIFYAALLEGFIIISQRNAIGMETGQFQIHAKGYLDDPDIYSRIDNPEKIINRLEEYGYNASSRLYAFALAASSSSSTGVMLRGVDLENEPLVTDLHQHIMSGSWLSQEDEDGVILGHKLARNLNIGIGSEVVIVGQAADGSMANELYQVRGILKAVGEALDRTGFLMPENTFRQLLNVPTGSHEITVVRRNYGNREDLTAATAELAALVPGNEVKNWRQLHPVLARILDTTHASLIFMLVITYAAVAMLTLNGMLMNVFERIHEYGVVKALGMPPWQIFGAILLEAMMQVSLASLLALTAAIPLSIYFEHRPLDLSGLAPEVATIAGVAFDPRWHSYLTVNAVLMPLSFLFFFTLLAIIYPAVRAAMITPRKAIYHR